MSKQNRRQFVQMIGAAAAITSPLVARSQAAAPPIRVGWAISKTGPFAGGAASAQIPNYQLWVSDVNQAGGHGARIGAV